MSEHNHKPRIEIYSGQAELIEAGKKFFIDRCGKAISDHGRFSVALSGGKTPEPLLRTLSDDDTGILWKQTHLFMVDERVVPYNHPDSNWGMICRQLVDRIEIPDANLHPIPMKSCSGKSADAYTGELQSFFQLKTGRFPVFDLMLMGLGSDGHTASLFPGTAALSVTDRSVVRVLPDHVPHERISITLPVIHQARCLLFLVTGESKAERIHDILIRNDRQFPATLACRGAGEAVFLLDRAAASMI